MTDIVITHPRLAEGRARTCQRQLTAFVDRVGKRRPLLSLSGELRELADVLDDGFVHMIADRETKAEATKLRQAVRRMTAKARKLSETV
jgi:phage tail tape-measure protein